MVFFSGFSWESVQDDLKAGSKWRCPKYGQKKSNASVVFWVPEIWDKRSYCVVEDVAPNFRVPPFHPQKWFRCQKFTTKVLFFSLPEEASAIEDRAEPSMLNATVLFISGGPGRPICRQ